MQSSESDRGNKFSEAKTHGAERGLDRFEGFSDAVFAIALTLLIVEIKVPGSPEGPHGYSDLVSAMAEQWREFLALVLCYVVIGAYWLQHHYSGRRVGHGRRGRLYIAIEDKHNVAVVDTRTLKVIAHHRPRLIYDSRRRQ